MPSTKTPSATTTRAPFQPVNNTHEIPTALVEILQRAIANRDSITENLVRSVIKVAFDDKVDWSIIGRAR